MLVKAIAFVAAILSARAGIASTFGVNDPGNPNGYAQCLHRPLCASDFGVALPRSYPCGTTVWVYSPRTGRAIVARKIDVGPAHCLVDLSTAAARALGSNGWERVIMVVVK